jgi:hypothetical protein
MKIKLDENISAALADSLHEFGHDVHTVPDEGLAGTSLRRFGRLPSGKSASSCEF